MHVDPHTLNWQLYAQIAQVAATVLTGVGIIISTGIGIRTVRELRADRSFRVQPRLLFDRGGEVVRCRLNDEGGIPGIDPTIAGELLRNASPTARTCIASRLWGKLTNHGTGSALDVRVTFITKNVIKADEQFRIDEKKLSEFPYHPLFNRIPAMPSNISPGSSAQFFRLPTPITVDFTGQIAQLEGLVSIEYQNIYGTQFEVQQNFRAFIERNNNPPEVTLTFSDEVPAQPKKTVEFNLPEY
jgi:hypothetical protein